MIAQTVAPIDRLVPLMSVTACLDCAGRGAHHVTYEADTGAWDGEDCDRCGGTGVDPDLPEPPS
jgi:DnaJ-class molecular chaperone